MNQDKQILDYYNALASEYDSDRFGNSYGQFIHKQEQNFLSHILKDPPARTVDLGCGTGRFLSFAQYGVDMSPEMLKIAALKFPEKNLIKSDATQTPFDSAFFDQAFSFHMVMHLSKEKVNDFLNEVHRILKPGGRLIVDFPSYKRRKLTSSKHRGHWHGSNSYSIADIKSLLLNKWNLHYYRGVMWIPVHRFPVFLRKFLYPIDSFLCRLFLKEYSSYLMVVLEKK